MTSLRCLALAGTAFGLLAACGPLPTREAYFDQLQTWIGKPSDLLAQTWGPPDKSFKLSDGSLQMQYDRVKQRYIPGASYPDTAYIPVRGKDGRVFYRPITQWRQQPGYVDIDRCSTLFTASATGVIQTFRFEGDDCVALPPPQPKVG
jgi:hypothetical protein